MSINKLFNKMLVIDYNVDVNLKKVSWYKILC